MWRVLSLVVVVCLVCLFSVRAQTVNEGESSVNFKDSVIECRFVVDNPGAARRDELLIELLDTENKTVAQSAQNFELKNGKETYRMTISAGGRTPAANDDFVWYRLRYRLGANQGTISLSELLKDNFELRVAASADVRAGMNYRVRARAFQPYTNLPSAGVAISGEVALDLATDGDEDELKLAASGLTDADGFALLEFRIPENAKLDGDGDLKITGIKNGNRQELKEDLDSSQFRGSIFFTADKPIYQPGQTFNARGLYFDANQNSVANSELEFRILDEDGTVLYREKVRTSPFGIASISWKIPENAKLGSYRVAAETDAELQADSMRFKVTRYDLPNFSVAAKPGKSFYLPADESAEIVVRADYLFGKPVAQGRVRVVQESRREWNYRKQQYETEEKQSFEGATDAEGKFTARADLREAFADLKQSYWRRYEDLHFAAYFTDTTTNKTEQKRFDVRLTREPIHIYFVKYEEYNAAMPATAYVSTFYADGTPAVCEVEIKGNYEESDDVRRVAKIKTNQFGAGKFTFRPAPGKDADANFKLKLTARDTNGKTGTYAEDLNFDKDDAIRIDTGKTIFKPGEAVKIDLFSTKKEGFVYIDIIREWSAIDSHFVKLKNGRANLKIPYRSDFKGDLTIIAYDDSSDRDYNDEMRSSRGIIFPAQQNLQAAANFSQASYKPNEEAQVSFSVADGQRKAIESALGVVVFDKAVEERARTDAEFGSYFSGFSWLLGDDRSFGGVTLKDLNDLNPKKKVSADLQLAAEVMLGDYHYYPRIYRTKENPAEAKTVYAAFFKNQFAPLEAILKNQFAKNYEYPADDASLRRILSANGFDSDLLRDPWNQPYRAAFAIAGDQKTLTFITAGANKIFGDPGDFSVSVSGFAYFKPAGIRIDEAAANYRARTGSYIRDYETLRAELQRLDYDLNNLKDAWNRSYRITFEVSRRNYVIRVSSDGANGVYQPNDWKRDDFDVWTNSADFFAGTESAVNEMLSRTVNRDKNLFPANKEEFAALLKNNGIDLDQIRDGYGNPVSLYYSKETRYADKTKIENGKQTITPVTREIVTFSLMSKGTNAAADYDDFALATFSSVIAETSRDTIFSKAEIRNIATSGTSGAISGTVYDAFGAIIPNAQITATAESDPTRSFTTFSDAEGKFLLENIPPGLYSVQAFAAAFQKTVYANIRIQAQNLVEMTIALQIGNVSETVEVSAGGEVMLSTSSATVTSIGRVMKGGGGGGGRSREEDKADSLQQTSTPRLREYFPETLVWSPELLTDKNGKAEMKFKLADNITTWKLYTIASTKNGKIGVAEKEIQAFQPFFVDLDPPKFLTAGDEIHLPTQVRNYTGTKQKVNVSMARAAWFSLLGAANQTVEVESGNSGNAVFGFKTTSAIKDGKQRVTALAAKDSDAIEKPVTVRPDGQEIIATDSKLFNKTASFTVEFPAETLPKTQKAELKIYPNLMAHVAESVEGLLQRPYGCGEQTISSTYPNLMILKFVKADSALRPTARKYLQRGYERLTGYQVADGGFSYWGGKDAADLALTAYAIRFLTDAKPFVAVDENIIKRAKDWLVKQQRADGSFTQKYYYENSENAPRTKLITSYIARTLARLEEKDSRTLNQALAYLKTKNAEIDEPYALSLYALALFDAGQSADAQKTVETLEKLAISEGTGIYWNLETNTPFYGWGTAGRVETTALVVQTLLKARSQNKQATNEKLDELISKGTLFLLKNKDRYGVWYSTQTTINVLDAFLAALAENPQTAVQNLQVILNGANIRNIDVPAEQIEPVVLNLDEQINPANNKIEIRSSNDTPVMSQVVSAHYVGWKNAGFSSQTADQSRALQLDYKCDKQAAKIMEEVSCTVSAEQIGFRGYGMLLAEIGIPPGADVSRESLQEAMKKDWSLSRYDILPDRIILYMWSKAGGTKFNFKFKPRYGINAQTPASVVYDYYNDEARATIAPLRFSVK